MKAKLLLLMIFTLLMPIGYVYAWGGNDNSDRLSSDQAKVFSPGYINAAKQQAYSIINQNNQPKGWWENLVARIKNKTTNEVKEHANTKVTPEVKKKTSSSADTSSNKTTITAVPDIKIGSGTDKRDINGKLVSETGKRMVSEIIDGVRYTYVGFDNIGFDIATYEKNGGSALLQGINYANARGGGVVTVKSGTYNAFYVSGLTKDIRVYGGFDENGNRDTNNLTSIKGAITREIRVSRGFYHMANSAIIANGISSLFEINGFNVSAAGAGTWSSISLYSCSNVRLSNLQIIGDQSAREGVRVLNSSVSVFDSKIIGQSNYGIVMDTAAKALVQNSKIEGQGIWAAFGDLNIANTDSPIDQVNGTVTYSNPISQAELLLPQKSTVIDTVASPSSANSLSSDYWRNISSSNIYGNYASSPYASFNRLSGNPLTQDAVSGIFKGLLANKDALSGNMVGDGGGLNKELIARLIDNSLGAQALAIPLDGQNRADQMNIALALANILKNPTDDQKLILDAVESLLADIKDLEDKAGANPELNKAENDLLQMVATCLLAQGVPDLLKAGDIEGIKGIFKDLGQTKDKIMMDYGQSIKPYYSNIVKELSSNLAMLQLKGILSKKITEEELRNLEPKEIDKILEAIRRSNDKSFEMEYLRQQDNKYRKEYLDPQNKALEEKMKLMLGGFTQKITKSLEDTR